MNLRLIRRQLARHVESQILGGVVMSLCLWMKSSHRSFKEGRRKQQYPQVSTGLSRTSSWPYPFSSLGLRESYQPDPRKITPRGGRNGRKILTTLSMLTMAVNGRKWQTEKHRLTSTRPGGVGVVQVGNRDTFRHDTQARLRRVRRGRWTDGVLLVKSAMTYL